MGVIWLGFLLIRGLRFLASFLRGRSSASTFSARGRPGLRSLGCRALKSCPFVVRGGYMAPEELCRDSWVLGCDL